MKPNINVIKDRLNEKFVIMNGKKVKFRFLSYRDKHLWTEFVNSCSPRSLWLRFLSPFNATPERAEQFCNINPEEQLAVVAEMSENERQQVIAIGRLVRCRDHEQVEYAFIVSDSWQNMTLGRSLTELCIDLAKILAYKTINAETIQQNYPVIRILKDRCNFKQKKKEENMINLVLTVK